MFTSASGISISSRNFNMSILYIQDRNIECTSQIKYSDCLFSLFFIQSISKSGSSWLSDHSFKIKTSNFCGLPSSLSLIAIEISRDSNNSSFNSFAEICFSSFLHFLKDKGSYLRRRVIFTFNLNPCISTWMLDDLVWHMLSIRLNWRVIKFSSNQPSDSKNSIFRIGNSLSFRSLPNEYFFLINKSDNRRSTLGSFRVFNNFDSVSFHNWNTRVGCSEADSNDRSRSRSKPSKWYSFK